jgi:uncharacterized protein DUF5916/cellulose/xylan binding protein with CBM9 domain
LSRLKSTCGVLALAAAESPDACAQASPRNQKTAKIVRTYSPPTLDGGLSDSAWGRAAVIDDLHQYDPVDHGMPTERTAIYLVYDDDNLYVGARMYDSEPQRITARQMVLGQEMEGDDSIGIYLDPFNSQRTGYVFQVNPNGNRVDGVFETPTEINRDWDGIWYADARIDEAGWTAELVIPFKTLSFDPSEPNWGFTVERTIGRKREQIAWVSFDRQVSPGAFGSITSLTGLRQGKGIDVVPSIVMSNARGATTRLDETEGDGSLDIFYKVSPFLTGVLTFNTDFSATEVDDRQINLTRFPLFLPEKRDFFLQDVDIFSFGGLSENGIPFFSRRIGFGDGGVPVDIDVGAKLTGRVGRWNVGVLDIQQGESAGLHGTNLFVGRVAANVLRESSVGMIITNGNPSEDLGNSLAGVDFRYRNTSLPSGHTLEGVSWYQRSDTQGIADEQKAWGLGLALPNSEGFEGEFAYEHIEENFNPALGFVNRSNVNRTDVGLGYLWRPDHRWIRTLGTSWGLENFDRISGGLESRSLFFELAEVETNSGEEFAAQLNKDREVLREPFEISDGITIAPGDYEFTRYSIEFEGSSERVFAPSMEIEKGEFFDGDILTVVAGLEWRPSRSFFLGVGYDYNDVELPGGDFVTRLVRVEATYAFNIKWSWVNLLQYDNESQSVGINSRVRWNPEAGQDLYIVLNHGLFASGTFSGLRTQASQITVKYARTFRF